MQSHKNYMYSVLLSTKHLKTVAHSSRSQYVANGSRRHIHVSRMSFICKLHSRITHCQAKFKVCRLWACCAISRLEHNLRILRMHNTILRLHKFSDCTEPIDFHLTVTAIKPLATCATSVMIIIVG